MRSDERDRARRVADQALSLWAARPDLAVRLAREALATNPGEPLALVVVARDHRVHGRAAEAEGAVRAAIESAPSEYLAHAELASIHADAGRRVDALAALAGAEDLRPIGPHRLAFRAEILRRVGSADDAESASAAALGLAPEDRTTRLTRAQVLLDAGRHAESERLVVSVLESDPEDVGAIRLLAANLLLLGRPGEARDAARRGLGIDPSNAECLYLERAARFPLRLVLVPAIRLMLVLARRPRLPRAIGRPLRIIGRPIGAVLRSRLMGLLLLYGVTAIILAAPMVITGVLILRLGWPIGIMVLGVALAGSMVARAVVRTRHVPDPLQWLVGWIVWAMLLFVLGPVSHQAVDAGWWVSATLWGLAVMLAGSRISRAILERSGMPWERERNRSSRPTGD